MFEDLRQAFREAVDNFKDELSRADLPEEANDLLRRMRREAADTRADIARLKKEVPDTARKAEKEKEEGKTCRRREKMAVGIDDSKTAELAREFAEKHEHRHSVLEQKLVVLQEELEMRRSEFADMIEAIKTAEISRDTLTATASRTSARNSIEDVDELFSELDRIADDIGKGDSRREASKQADNMMKDGGQNAPEEQSESQSIDVDARLEALKHAMDDKD